MVGYFDNSLLKLLGRSSSIDFCEINILYYNLTNTTFMILYTYVDFFDV